MLVETYESKSMITTVSGTDKTIILTTAKSDDSIYPYRGTAGTTCTIIRSGFTDKTMFYVKCNLTFKDITIDGGGLTCSANGALIYISDVGGTKCELGETAILQNSHTKGSGGAVHVEYSDFNLNGGMIINCSTTGNGGAIYMNSQTKTNNPQRGYLRLISGNITGCSANNGGAVYVNKGTMTITAVRIQSCTATETAAPSTIPI
ncbi:MAG: hypothetical protein IKQ18_08415 [Clostridia bacterium]|nr:hypothetical protein [Clostridia bacterium]